jgi:hypothetical protein
VRRFPHQRFAALHSPRKRASDAERLRKLRAPPAAATRACACETPAMMSTEGPMKFSFTDLRDSRTRERESRRATSRRRFQCNLFEFWRRCRRVRCHRERTCVGDPHACFDRLRATIPPAHKDPSRAAILARSNADMSMTEQILDALGMGGVLPPHSPTSTGYGEGAPPARSRASSTRYGPSREQFNPPHPPASPSPSSTAPASS